jgi:hypothetical protein
MGAFLAPAAGGCPLRGTRQKPGYPLQFLGLAPQVLRDFRFYPLRGFLRKNPYIHCRQAAGANLQKTKT